MPSRLFAVVETRYPILGNAIKLNEKGFTMNLIISNQAISTYDSLYSLNDLHRASGNAKKHQPSNFLANQQTKELISEIENEGQIAHHTVKGNRADGAKQGTYVCRELVLAYAMWISPKFSLMVIRAFDTITTTEVITPTVNVINAPAPSHGELYKTFIATVNLQGVMTMREMGKNEFISTYDDLPNLLRYRSWGVSDEKMAKIAKAALNKITGEWD